MKRLRKVLLTLVAVAVLAAVLAAAAGGWLWWRLHRPYQGYRGESTVVAIEPGDSGARILARLEGEGVLEDAELARLYLIFLLGDPPLRAGEYEFSGPLTTPEVLAKLLRGAVVLHSVTLIEGLTLEESAEHLAGAGFGDRAAFLEAMRGPCCVPLVAGLDPDAEDLEGYLFPDTYHFARGTSEEAVVRTLARAFRDHWETEVEPVWGGSGTESRAIPAPGAPRTVRQLVTLASIVEKEAQLDEERPLVASVYANRLRIGMALQADPTVIFALKLRGTWDGNLRRDDLRFDSPYNTYRYPGLPPGPIASPGLASLLAAAFPAESPYLYFVSRNDGSHVFSRSLAEHNRNVYRWQKQYWREKWAKEGRR